MIYILLNIIKNLLKLFFLGVVLVIKKIIILMHPQICLCNCCLGNTISLTLWNLYVKNENMKSVFYMILNLYVIL